MTKRILATALLCLLIGAGTPFAQQVYGPLSNCSGTVGTSAANVAFPSSGTGGTGPTLYLLLQNNSTSAQDIWFSTIPGVPATTAAPSWHMPLTGAFEFTTVAPMPSTVSIIASAAGAAYSCWYK